jgi:formylglycine-generating enzyme required for sulfatase activity
MPMFYRVRGVAPTTNAAPAGMVLISAGTFSMGDPFGILADAALVTNVYVSAFYMDTNLVTLSQWQAVYTYGTNHDYNFWHSGSGKGATHPVQTIDWFDAVKWCNARSEQAGLQPVYYTNAEMTLVYRSGVDGSGFPLIPYVNWSANGYRLPTEAEWEKAARSGLNGLRYPWGNTISQTQANYSGATSAYAYDLGPNGYNSIGIIGGSPYTSPVGTFPPNGYGLYDMAGNVVQWCWDDYGIPYAGGSNPHGKFGTGQRVMRGGSWAFNAIPSQCGCRGYSYPVYAYNYIGFRCVKGN